MLCKIGLEQGLPSGTVISSCATKDPGCQVTVFPPSHWCGWLPGSAGIVSRNGAAWPGCFGGRGVPAMGQEENK